MDLVPSDTAIGKQDDINCGIVDIIRPYLKGPIIEVNSGSGSLGSLLASEGIRIHLSDPEKATRDLLRDRFKEIEEIRAVHSVDANSENFENVYREGIGLFNTVLAVNVFEYGYLGSQGIKHLKVLLPSRGRLILIAPSPVFTYKGAVDGLNEYHAQALKPLKIALGDNFKIAILQYLDLSAWSQTSFSLGLSMLVIARKE